MIETRTAKIYYAPTARRRYLSKLAAIKGEARAIIMAKHPRQWPEPEVGFSGWHWREIPRSDVLLRRMMQIVKRSSKE